MALAFTMVVLSALAAAPWAEAQTYNVLYNFTGGADGGYPYYGSLVQDKAGNLYGTTGWGGTYDSYGTVFKVTKSGAETVLYSFTGGADGAWPYAGLILSGNTLYGTTEAGGTSTCQNDYGCGVVFQLNIETGAETVLYTFTGSADGANPYAGLVQDKKGHLYGTTYGGGAYGYGTVFEVAPKTKKETVLHSFDSTDGAYPQSGLTLNTAGEVLFGTAPGGGSRSWGVVFSLTTNTRTYTVLYNFKGSSDGGVPWGTMALDAKGNLYGTTWYGGDISSCESSSCGTVFEVIPKTKKETVLYAFAGVADGGSPLGGVIRDKKDTLYGTTAGGGPGDRGVVFELVKGTETVLHSFDYKDGSEPLCGVIMDSSGDLFGTTYGGGSGGYGVVWEITP
jgi:uncharacterized repeat protein (TIGR03803 family)